MSHDGGNAMRRKGAAPRAGGRRSATTPMPATGRGSADARADTPLARLVGRTRFVVLLPVAVVLVIALCFVLLATWLAVVGIWHAFSDALRGELDGTAVTVEFLEVISVVLKAVIFYIVGVGLYSLFIAPLNLTTALGIETLSELERRLVGIIILILAVTLLEHFIRWENPNETLRFGATLALTVAALVAFQLVSQRGDKELYTPDPETQARAQHELYSGQREEREVTSAEVEAVRDQHAES